MFTVLIGAAFAAALYYPVMLRARSNWRANPAGKAQMLFACIIAGVLGLAFARQLGWTSPTWLRIAVYGLVLVGLVVQDVTLTKAQNRRAVRIERERAEGIERLKESK